MKKKWRGVGEDKLKKIFCSERKQTNKDYYRQRYIGNEMSTRRERGGEKEEKKIK